MKFRVWPTMVLRLVGVFLAPLLAAGCLSVDFVSNHDPEIDAGLTRMHTETTAFVDRMIGSRGTPEGTYVANKDFYIEQIAAVDTLVLRAEAHRVLGRCPAPELMGAVLTQARTRIESRQTSAGLSPQLDLALEQAKSQLSTLATDDCEVGLLRLIRMNFQEMRTFHEAQADRGIPESARGPLLEGGLGSTIRSALTVEIAKKGVTTTSDGDQ